MYLSPFLLSPTVVTDTLNTARCREPAAALQEGGELLPSFLSGTRVCESWKRVKGEEALCPLFGSTAQSPFSRPLSVDVGFFPVGVPLSTSLPMPMMQEAAGGSRLMEFSRHACAGGGPPPPKKRRLQMAPLVVLPVEMARSSPAAGFRSRQDPFSDLPDECVCLVFAFIPSPRHRCSCAAVSRRWLLLQAHMRPSDFRCHSPAPTAVSASLPPSTGYGDGAAGQIMPAGGRTSRCLYSLKATDARLASMAVGACARPALTELTIKTNSLPPPPGSSLLNITDAGLRTIAQACPKLRRLTLWHCNKVGNGGLDAVARFCPELEELCVYHTPLVGDDGLARVAERCSKLSAVSVRNCPLVGDGALRALARWSSNLGTISLDRCPRMTDSGLVALLSSLPRLTNVRVAHAEVGDGALEAVGPASRGPGSRARKLCLENVSGFTRLGLEHLLRAANLESLCVRSCAGINGGSFPRVNGGEGGLVLRGVGLLLPQAAPHLGSGLRHIAVKSCDNLSDEALVSLGAVAEHLESLQLEKCHGITAAGLVTAIKNWSGSLKSLSLLDCNGIVDINPAEKGLLRAPPTKRCRLLQCLEIKKCSGVGDEFLALMGTMMAKARRLAVVGMSSVTDRGIISLLASLEEPRDVVHSADLSGCRGLTDWSVAALASSSGRSLQRLLLEGCEGITDRSLKLVGTMCPGAVELDLTGCRRISDAGVAALVARGGVGSAAAAAAAAAAKAELDGGGKKSRLEVLSLEGCDGITDGCLGVLEEMAVEGSLVGLNLKHCGGLSPANVDAVRQALWWCDVIY